MSNYIRLAFFLLFVFACSGLPTCADDPAWLIDGVPISSDAKDVLLHQMQAVITTITAPTDITGMEISDEQQRQNHIVFFLDAWKKEVVRSGRELDEYIKDGQESLASVSFLSINAGFASLKGHFLAQQWQSDIDKESINRLSVRSILVGRESLSRKEMIQAHPHAEAIIYLSRVLSRPAGVKYQPPPQAETEHLE